MEKNVGGLDRFFRFGIGFLSLAIAVTIEDVLLQLVFGLVAIVGLATAATGYCPLNRRLGINTRGNKES